MTSSNKTSKFNYCCSGTYECGAEFGKEILCTHHKELPEVPVTKPYVNCQHGHRDDQVCYCSSQEAQLEVLRSDIKDLEEAVGYKGDKPVEHVESGDYLCPKCNKLLIGSYLRSSYLITLGSGERKNALENFCPGCGVKLNWEGKQ